MSDSGPRAVLVDAREVSSLSPLSSRFDVTVHSSANPEPKLLAALRLLVQAHPELGDLFISFRKESLGVDWLRDMLATRVVSRLNAEFEEVLEACQYLADEYHQLDEGYFIVSTETGRVVLVVTEDDLYDPGLQARHSGEMAQALRRLRPHLETGFMLHGHERAREQQVVSALAERSQQTDLLREGGDSRLRIATRTGRMDIARDLAGDDAWALLRRSSGTTGMFLRHFELVEHIQAPSLEGTATFRSTMSVQDGLAANISYNRLGTLRGAAPQGWIRDVARDLCAAVHRRTPIMPVEAEDLDAELLATEELWVADPDVYALIRKGKSQAVPVEGVSPIGFSGKVGCLRVPREFSVSTHESGGQWEVTANLPYSLWVDFAKVRALPIIGVQRAATVEF